ncbi:hypothetical protein [Nocardia gamkensis]|uniref:hypothetical protein n=1 Tax=Nocardia gamkensis TaxID=352869 RepID=UPI0037C6B3C7
MVGEFVRLLELDCVCSAVMTMSYCGDRSVGAPIGVWLGGGAAVIGISRPR